MGGILSALERALMAGRQSAPQLERSLLGDPRIKMAPLGKKSAARRWAIGLGMPDPGPKFSGKMGRLTRLPGLPKTSTGPIENVVRGAEQYSALKRIEPNRQDIYGVADPTRGRMIADAYTRMQHAPFDPKTRRAYKAMAKETLAQWREVKNMGLDVDWIKPGMPDPYPAGPKDVLQDLKKNNHLWVFPTDSGYGNDLGFKSMEQQNPLLAHTGETLKGHKMRVNDVFRIVHDYFGHGLEGVGFGARGEENAWRAHSRLYSKEALPAVTSETRGQNSWVNFGPYGKANRANQRGTIYADQKVGLMPEWTYREGGMPERFDRAFNPLPESVDPVRKLKPLMPLGDPRRQGIYTLPLAVGGGGILMGDDWRG